MEDYSVLVADCVHESTALQEFIGSKIMRFKRSKEGKSGKKYLLIIGTVERMNDDWSDMHDGFAYLYLPLDEFFKELVLSLRKALSKVIMEQKDSWVSIESTLSKGICRLHRMASVRSVKLYVDENPLLFLRGGIGEVPEIDQSFYEREMNPNGEGKASRSMFVEHLRICNLTVKVTETLFELSWFNVKDDSDEKFVSSSIRYLDVFSSEDLFEYGIPFSPH